MKRETILILDGGGSPARVVCDAVRKLNVYCEILPHNYEFDANEYIGLILAGNTDFHCKDVDLPILDLRNKEIKEEQIETFLKNEAKASCNWNMDDYAEQMIEQLSNRIGDRNVVCALSGGVDSAVLAVLLHRAIGHNLQCIFVDHGLLRKDEANSVMKNLSFLNIRKIDAQERFLSRLKGVLDPEEKRKIIGEEFIRVFEDEKIGQVPFFAQGTIYPDVIESGSIKSHHNVGGLPGHFEFEEIIEPLKYLFKYEVRKLGEKLDIPPEILHRQPFPGPGLGVRVVGEITREKLDILREADHIWRQIVTDNHVDAQQFFAAILDIRSVGIENEERTYGYTIVLRAVNTLDFVGAKYTPIPHRLLEQASSMITQKVRGVSRVVYDITNKPPATIEWE